MDNVHGRPDVTAQLTPPIVMPRDYHNNFLNQRMTRRSFLTIATRGMLASIALAGWRMKSAHAQSGISVPSARWRDGAYVRHHLIKRAISTDSIAWRSDSQRVAWRNSNGPGYVFDVQSGEYIAELPAPQMSGVESLIWLKDTNIILLGGSPLGAKRFSPVAFIVVNGQSGEIIRVVNGAIPPIQPRDPSAADRNYPLSPIANCADQIFQDHVSGDIIVKPIGGLRGFERFNPTTWDIQIENLKDHTHRLCDLRPYSHEAAFLDSGGYIFVANRRTGKTLHRVYAHPADGRVLKYSPDGQLLLSGMLSASYGRNDQTDFDVTEVNRHKVKAWRASDLHLLGQIDADIGACRALDFHPDGEIFTVASNDGEIVFFDSKSMMELARSTCPIREATGVVFSPDGSWLAVTGVSGIVCLMSP